jgi:MFS family permease
MRALMNEDRLLAIPAFRHFWLGRLAATAANQIFALVIGWEIYELTSSAWWLGVAGLVQFLPSLLSFLLAGDLADRIDRRLILIGVMIAMSAMAVALWLAALANAVSLPLLLAVCALLGLVRPFQMSAQQSLPSVLVAPRLLARAVALSSAGSQAVFIVAPALAGLVLIAGAVHVYALCTLVCVAGWVFHVRIRYDYTPPAPRPRSIADLFGGAVFIWQRPGLLGSITLDLFVVMLASVSGLLPVFAKDVLEADSWGLGLLRSAPAVGAVAISFLIARWRFERHTGRIMFTSVAVFSLSLVVFGLSRDLVLSLVALAISGAADMVSVVIRQTMVQIDTPDPMRGRVSAFNSIAVTASNQLGDFRCGALAHLVGAVPAVVAGAVAGIAITGLWIYWFPGLWARKRIDESPPG